MRTLWTTVVILGFVTAGTSVGRAQVRDDRDLPPLTARTIPLATGAIYAPHIPTFDSARYQTELQQWIHDFSEWKTWVEQWGNRREPGWFSDYRQRRERPIPPDWLFDRCGDSLEDTGPMAQACAMVAEWRTDYGTSHATNVRVAARTGDEEDDKTIWWEHLHLDVAWPAVQSGISLYGVVGMHATTSVRGRLEIFVAPGAMLLNVPTRNGGRAWKLATNYGIAFRLGQFTFPGGRQALLHVNLAKAWLFDTGPEIQTRSTDFVGLSMTFKKKP